jgi:membrane fusion protein, multidrug efflux system
MAALSPVCARRGARCCHAALCALVVAAGCDRGASQASSQPPPTAIPAGELVTVSHGTVSSGPLIAGTLEASRGATIVAELGGTVQEVGPEIGAHVAAGTILVRIDPSALGNVARSAAAQVSAQRTQLATARRELERVRHLVDVNAIPRRELEDAETRVATLEAAVAGATAQRATAQEQLGRSMVRSPLDGVVARRSVNVGDVVAPGAPLYQVIDPSSLRLEAAVPSTRVEALTIGAPVEFEVRGYPDRTFAGRITRISPQADAATRQIPILVDVANPQGKLLAGLFAQGRLVIESATGLVIPSAAVDDSTGQPSVLRVRNNAIERVPVELGLRDPMTDRVLVARGLAAGDRVVARAVAAPPPGTRITTGPAS